MDRLTGNYLAQQVVLKTESLDVKSRLAKAEYDTMTLHDQASRSNSSTNCSAVTS